jgi:hypothetical protein
MNLDMAVWVATAELALLLCLVWTGARKLKNLLLQTLNSVNAISVMMETTGRSYLGIESPWERSWRELGEFGVKDLPPISHERMGKVLLEILRELRTIRVATVGTSTTDFKEGGTK